MNPDFQKALAFVLNEEGGFTNDANDHGGATNLGIIQREYDEYRKRKGLGIRSVEAITHEEAADIYLNEYWLPAKCDKMPWPVSLVHFDAAVNTGIHQAALFLQRTVGVADDGVVGPKTLQALAQDVNDLGALPVALKIAECHRPFYRGLAEKDPSQRDFLDGWLQRVVDLEEYAHA